MRDDKKPFLNSEWLIKFQQRNWQKKVEKKSWSSKFIKYKCCWRQIFEILIIHKPFLGPFKVLHNIWAQSVQMFWRLLDTRFLQSGRQNIGIRKQDHEASVSFFKQKIFRCAYSPIPPPLSIDAHISTLYQSFTGVFTLSKFKTVKWGSF